ncbi:hypothetical protein X798_03626 [Onchocerca flexuosa]|uniref:Uncharacterized protein n=1 Tax=Onchocerca flexuosa TaxID=387005 RepID=A0A238BWJ2_9BILA|nr:hypothetical protein X798_03626 [Onchocerca flexuosa]
MNGPLHALKIIFRTLAALHMQYNSQSFNLSIIYSTFQSVMCFRLLFYAEKANSSTEIWHEMIGRNFDAKKLCVFAWYLIERGQQPDVGFDDRKVGLVGSRLYISLCCLSGAQAFNIFNDYLFQSALEELRLIRRLLSNNQLSTTHNRIEISTKNFEQLTLEDATELRYMLCDVLDSLFVFLNRGLISSTQQSLVSLAIFLQQLMQLDFSEKSSVCSLRFLRI